MKPEEERERAWLTRTSTATLPHSSSALPFSLAPGAGLVPSPVSRRRRRPVVHLDGGMQELRGLWRRGRARRPTTTRGCDQRRLPPVHNPSEQPSPRRSRGRIGVGLRKRDRRRWGMDSRCKICLFSAVPRSLPPLLFCPFFVFVSPFSSI